MKNTNQKTGFRNILSVIISLVTLLIMLVPSWITFKGNNVTIVDLIKYIQDPSFTAGGAAKASITAISVLCLIALIASIISIVALVVYAIIGKRRTVRARFFGRLAFVLVIVSTLCSFFITYLGNFFLVKEFGQELVKEYNAAFYITPWAIVAFAIGVFMVFFFIPNMPIVLKEGQEAPKKIVNDGFYSTVSVMEEKALNAVEKKAEKKAEEKKADAEESNLSKKEQKAADKDTLKRLLSYLKPHRGKLILALIAIVVGQASSGIAPFIMGKCTNGVIDMAKIWGQGAEFAKIAETFRNNIIILIIVYIAYTLFDFLGQYVLAGVTEKTLYTLRADIDAKIRRIPLNYFDTTSFGDVLSRVTNDIDAISVALQQSIYTIVKSISLVAVMIIMMLMISPMLTGIGVLVIPAAMLISMIIITRSAKHFAKKQDLIGQINGYVEEMYEGHNIITAFGREDDVQAKFDNYNAELEKTSITAEFAASSLMSVSMALTNVSYAVVATISGLMALSGQMSVGMIQSFLQYLQEFGKPINETSQISGMLQSTNAAAARVFEFIDEEEESPDPENPIALEKVEGEVHFDHVQFGYIPGQILVHDLSAVVKPGSKVGVVGPTGAGKSTLINLLMRFYEVTNGSISIDGVKTTDMTRRELRRHFGMVLQDPWLFKGTIKENLRYGKLDASDEVVYAAAKAAHCEDFILKLPGGYDFELAENGSNLSQGQRQLLTIARAFVSDPEMLILDEATSSVDTRTEKTIQSAMVNLMKGRTSFVIAHRLSTIKDSQLILYMQNGDILEQGTHDELMAKDGLYAKLYNSQFA